MTSIIFEYFNHIWISKIIWILQLYFDYSNFHKLHAKMVGHLWIEDHPGKSTVQVEQWWGVFFAVGGGLLFGHWLLGNQTGPRLAAHQQILGGSGVDCGSPVWEAEDIGEQNTDSKKTAMDSYFDTKEKENMEDKDSYPTRPQQTRVVKNGHRGKHLGKLSSWLYLGIRCGRKTTRN